MTAAEAAHAFDRFWRAETSRTRTGSGLGLPIAQAIVNAHGGTIHLKPHRHRAPPCTSNCPWKQNTDPRGVTCPPQQDTRQPVPHV